MKYNIHGEEYFQASSDAYIYTFWVRSVDYHKKRGPCKECIIKAACTSHCEELNKHMNDKWGQHTKIAFKIRTTIILITIFSVTYGYIQLLRFLWNANLLAV